MYLQVCLAALLACGLVQTSRAQDDLTSTEIPSVATDLGVTSSAPTAEPNVSSSSPPESNVTSSGVPSGNLITKDELDQAMLSLYPSIALYPRPSDAQYNSIVSKAGPIGNITDKRELAMFLANVVLSSKGFTQIRELNPTNYSYPHSLNVPGKEYYGRGYINLAWAYNYLAASLALYGDDRLLQNPDLVETDDQVAWDVSFWYWAANVHNKLGVADGLFGVTTNAINGLNECGPNRIDPDSANMRFAIYQKFFAAFGLSGQPDSRGC